MASGFEEDQEKLQDLLQCLVCLGEYDSPKMLSCGHSFCAGCLQPLLGESSYRREIRCPACRTVSRLPWTGVSGLPDDFKINRIREIVEKQQKEDFGPLPCDFCKSRRLKVRSQFNCTQCYKYLCKSCVDKHDNNPLFKSHCVVELPQDGASVDLTCICEQHAREPVRYFCQICRQLLCTLCTLEHDQDHEIRPIDRMLEQYQHTLEGFIDSLGAKLAKILPVRSTLELRVKEQQAACDEAEKAIRELTESLVAKARDRERDLLNRLDQEREKRMDNAGLHVLDALNVKVKEIEILNRRICALLNESSNPSQMLSAYETMVLTCQNALEAGLPDEAPEDPTARTIIHFVESEAVPVIVLGTLTSVEVPGLESDEPDMAVSPGERDRGWFTRFRNYWVGSGSENQRSSDVIYQNKDSPQSIHLSKFGKKCLLSLKKMGSGFGEILAASDVSTLPDGKLVVSEFGNKRLQIFSDRGEPQQTISGETSPYGVAVTEQGNIISVDSQEASVMVYRRDGVVVSSWGEGILNRPHGVAISKGGYLIISDVNRHSVSVHGLCGRVIREFGSQGNGDNDFDHPFYVTVDNNDHIVVSDCWNHCVKVFDTSGKFLLKFGKSGTRDGQLRYPGGVCVTDSGDFIVADTMNHRICSFSSQGRFKSNLLTEEDGVWYPSGISLTDAGNLLFTECNGMTHTAVKMFTI